MHDIRSGREHFVCLLFQEKDHKYICILQLNNLYIFDGLIYHQSTSKDLENHPCSFSIIIVRTVRIAEHPNQRAIVEKSLYRSIDY